VAGSVDHLRHRLVGLRDQRGALTELSRTSGIARSLIDKWISGEFAPNLESVDRLAAALGRSAAELIADPELSNNQLPDRLIGLLKQCSDNQREALIAVISAFSHGESATLPSSPKRRILDLLPSLDDSQASFYLNMIEKELAAARGSSSAKPTIKTKKER
jgi:transcriptional regulator with XRE-family HTH domain